MKTKQYDTPWTSVTKREPVTDKQLGLPKGTIKRCDVDRAVYELGQHGSGWWCRDKSRPGLLVVDDGAGNEFDFPQDALQACCDAAAEYDALLHGCPGSERSRGTQRSGAASLT